MLFSSSGRRGLRALSFAAFSFALVSFTAAGSMTGCKSDTNADLAADGERSCSFTVWHKPASSSSSVELVGDFNGWKRPGLVVDATRSDGWRVTRIPASAGEQRYAIIEDGVWMTDSEVPTTAFWNGTEVAWVDVPNCAAPGVTVNSITSDPTAAGASGDATVTLSLARSSSGAAFDPSSFTWTAFDGSAVTVDPPIVDEEGATATSVFHGLAYGKHTFTLNAKDANGVAADPATASIWMEPAPFDLRDTVMYQIMVDRFANEKGHLATPANPAARAGGDIAGVQAAIDDGTFAALGVNTLWLSPMYQNPNQTFIGSDSRQYSSYHGYWPIQPRQVEDLYGGAEALSALMADAHRHGMRILYDVVPNHVHFEHPYFQQHSGDGWFDDLGGQCVCGQGSCDWATHMLDCWFAYYLPDLNWENADVATQVTSDVRWWIDQFDGDGIRIDAVPMMPRAATRRIVKAIRDRYDTVGHRSFLLGENFTDESGYNLLKYELGPFGLNSEFHFPLMWALREAVAYDSATASTVQSLPVASGSGSSDGGTVAVSAPQSMKDVAASVAAGLAAWGSSDAVMTLMIGNHDVTRFATASSGDESGDTWTPAPQPTDPVVYEKQALALAAVFTLPGAPVIYYGDEVGLAGRLDPDSRRIMPSDAELSGDQKSLRSKVEALSRARSCSAALRRGDYQALYYDAEHYVFSRTSGDDTAIVALSRRPTAASPVVDSVTLPGIAKGTYADIFAGGAATLDPELTNLDRAAFSVHVYVPQASACAYLASGSNTSK